MLYPRGEQGHLCIMTWYSVIGTEKRFRTNHGRAHHSCHKIEKGQCLCLSCCAGRRSSRLPAWNWYVLIWHTLYHSSSYNCRAIIHCIGEYSLRSTCAHKTAAIIYAAFGGMLALEVSGVDELQKQCATTFSGSSNDKYVSYNSGGCGDAEPRPINYTHQKTGVVLEPTMYMCGANQSYIGCSFDDYRTFFASSTGFGLSCIVVRDICLQSLHFCC